MRRALGRADIFVVTSRGSHNGGPFRRLRSVLHDERGIALVLALIVLTLLTAVLTTVVSLTAANARDAQRSNAGIKASALAETGINNALAVINGSYSGSVAYPGDSTLLSPRTTTYPGGSVTWSGTLVSDGATPPVYTWQITSTGAAANPTGVSAASVTRAATAAVPVILPASQQNNSFSTLNWIYSGTDTTFSQSVQVNSPVYTVGNLTLLSSATIAGTAQKLAVGGNLTLSTTQNQIGLTGGSDPRIGEAHIVGKCSVRGNVTLHFCGGSSGATNWDSDNVYATSTSHSLTGLLDHQPSLTCCAPVSGAIAPSSSGTSDMGFWYRNADLGPLKPCTTGSLPFQLDTGDSTINNSVTSTSPINLTPSSGSYSCTNATGQLSWDASAKKLTIKGTIFIDGSATIDSSGYGGSTVFTYSGSATLILSGTFGMKSTKICAVVSGTDCNWTTSAWDPNANALVVVADGDGANGGAQSQTSVQNGDGIGLVTGASFQGALIANKNIQTSQTATEEGPMISVYNQVNSGQIGTLSFPAIAFAPTAATSIANGTLPTGQLQLPRNFGS
jgi:hypothetical protein